VLLDSRRGVHEVVKVGWARVNPGTGASVGSRWVGGHYAALNHVHTVGVVRKPCIMPSGYENNTLELYNGRVGVDNKREYRDKRGETRVMRVDGLRRLWFWHWGSSDFSGEGGAK
jgi:hypothetical protein